MAKLTTDKALSILIDSDQAKKVLKPSYIRQVKHRLKTGKNLELSKKIEILEKLGAVANELTWNVKTNGKTDSMIDWSKNHPFLVTSNLPIQTKREN